MQGARTDTRPPEGVGTRKSELFCARCGHHSPVGGDWIAYVGVHHYRYECPTCCETVVVQPAFAAADGAG